MFGNIEGIKVVGYSFVDPQEPRVIFEREAILARTSLIQDVNPYFVFSKSELEGQIENLSRPEKQSPKGSPAYNMQMSRVKFAKFIVGKFEEIKETVSDLLSDRRQVVLAPDLPEHDQVLVIAAVVEHTRKAAEKELENLPNRYINLRFLNFDFGGELLAIFSVPKDQDSFESVQGQFNRAALIDLYDKYLVARNIFHIARPDQANTYNNSFDLIEGVLGVLDFFEHKQDDAERFCDAICALNGVWEVDDTFYKDKDGRLLFKLNVDCNRKKFTLYLDSNQTEQLLEEVLNLQQFLTEPLFNRLVSSSFVKAATEITSRISMIRKGFINFDNADIVQGSDKPNLAF